MMIQAPRRCSACQDGVEAPFPFSMAFQPIVDVNTETVFAYEALVRGMEGQGAGFILDQVNAANRYSFDQSCRVRALTLASQLGLARTGAHLSINFMPGAVYSAASCIRLTLNTANKLGFPLDKLMFEVTENEAVEDSAHLSSIIEEYRRHGFKVAMDDFGAGHSGLSMLAEFQTDVLKFDMSLTRNLRERPAATKIICHMVSLARSLGCEVIAEGIENVDEFVAVRECGISLMQGYLFARPGFEALPPFTIPQLDAPYSSRAATASGVREHASV